MSHHKLLALFCCRKERLDVLLQLLAVIYSVFNLGQLQPPFVLSLSKHEQHTSTSSMRTVTL
ncbi:hypothetical protein CRENPOLYSF1_1390016 [Crenothrix polyspora]|uniref:Uncharacterized protein n=1 Tax=Crenothrix polyspora TaxID=360316 RepID=A0A1R4H1X1_9GAMM|nr:hypothetical protein CRENPOLYSF1_1390016 [Crenothrix polyspora]